MGDDLHRMVGEVNGKLDALTTMMRDYIDGHERRHERIEEELAAHARDLNQAKGARAALLAVAACIAGLVSAVAAAVEKIFR